MSNLPIKSFAVIKDQMNSMAEKPEFFRSRCVITFIKHDERFSYPACPGKEHSTKVTVQTSGSWFCEKCNKSYDKPEHRYIMSVTAADQTASQWLNFFNEPAQQLLKTSADNIMALKAVDQKAGEEYFQNALFTTHVMKIRGKMETYQEEARLRLTVLDIEPIKWAKEAQVLLSEIRGMC